MKIEIDDLEKLADLITLVLIGRARHAKEILEGAEYVGTAVSQALKARLLQELRAATDPHIWHRDGLLFEIICWLGAVQQAEPHAAISAPHLKSTTQGFDTLRVAFDSGARQLISLRITECKCTINARAKFRDEVLPSFQTFSSGERDSELVQSAIALLDKFELSNEESLTAYRRIVTDRALSFQAALTVTPSAFTPAECLALFKGYSAIPVEIDFRIGDTLPVKDIRETFKELADLVASKIELLDV